MLEQYEKETEVGGRTRARTHTFAHSLLIYSLNVASHEMNATECTFSTGIGEIVSYSVQRPTLQIVCLPVYLLCRQCFPVDALQSVCLSVDLLADPVFQKTCFEETVFQ